MGIIPGQWLGRSIVIMTMVMLLVTGFALSEAWCRAENTTSRRNY